MICSKKASDAVEYERRTFSNNSKLNSAFMSGLNFHMTPSSGACWEATQVHKCFPGSLADRTEPDLPA